jgi:hypothetical protein
LLIIAIMCVSPQFNCGEIELLSGNFSRAAQLKARRQPHGTV